MIWAAIKHALNSSLGAANFDPLDVTLGKRGDAAGMVPIDAYDEGFLGRRFDVVAGAWVEKEAKDEGEK